MYLQSHLFLAPRPRRLRGTSGSGDESTVYVSHRTPRQTHVLGASCTAQLGSVWHGFSHKITTGFHCSLLSFRIALGEPQSSNNESRAEERRKKTSRRGYKVLAYSENKHFKTKLFLVDFFSDKRSLQIRQFVQGAQCLSVPGLFYLHNTT